MQQTVFTIGHSTHTSQHFISLLQSHRITAICDVRSKPYSRTNPQFNREDLKATLRAYGIAYVFLGKELGARSDDPACYEHGQVQYDRLAQTDLFRRGLDRVQEGINKYRIALMCAEKEPLECHRTILVARHLQALGFKIQHIHASGALESHQEALDRLINTIKLPDHDMFRTHLDVIEDAYRIQGERIAYSRDNAQSAESIAYKKAVG